jgi:hypothetical protein
MYIHLFVTTKLMRLHEKHCSFETKYMKVITTLKMRGMPFREAFNV